MVMSGEGKTSEMNGKIDIGLDIGSVSLNTVLINEEEQILEDHYTRMKGQPVQTVLKVLGEVLKRYPQERIGRVAVTGSGGKLIGDLIGAEFVNEIVSQARAVEHLYPQVRTIIDMGGEDSKLIILNSGGSGKLIIEDFSMNTICAAGTGSFLDQQATRLGLSINEEFGTLALKSKNPPRIAGRCSVFAKTDMIHLQQEAAPDYDIVAGLCYALARNFKSSIGKGKEFKKPVIFQGGVAANKGMVKAFQDILETKEGELIIPRYYASMGAIGAVLIVRVKSKAEGFRGLEGLENYLKTHKDTHEGLAPLLPVTHHPAPGTQAPSLDSHNSCLPAGTLEESVDCYLGIDVGSISTNVVAIDEEGRVLARSYLMTAGRPLEAVRQGIKEIRKGRGDCFRVIGVGTTGSGRYLIGNFVGADIVKNEITAQATAAAAIDPAVDTIFEIGGQDSKYIGLEGGAVVDFEMNKVCAAGTGSFLEEQAEKLEINIKEEFGNLALQAECPVRLGERCTVFMETNLVSHQQKGTGGKDLVAGLSYSIVDNYLNRVVGNKKIGNNIFFQGAVALNQGVVAAFEKVLGKKITVPPNNDVTGAIGVALCARESQRVKSLESKVESKSKFKGFEAVSEAKYELRSFECPDCPNHCEIREVRVENEQSLFYGSRCEKYNVDKEKNNEDIPDLFAEREKILLHSYSKSSNLNLPLSGKIGIPRALIFHELYPLWQAFFTELGFEVIFSDKTNKKTIHQGLESVVAETCFPIKVAHGHVLNLVEKKVDYVFLPTIVNMKQSNPSMEQSFACPYVQTLPHFIRSAIDLEGKGIKIIDPVLAFGWSGKLIKLSLKELAKSLGKKGREVDKAILAAEEAQENFYRTVQDRGREVLNSLDGKRFAVVIVSRPYNGCDAGINLNLPGKLRDLGAIPIPMDYLPLDTIDLSKEFPDMYWRYGQKILCAAEIIRKNEKLQALYITNFGCGPDSFIARFFREKMGNKPYLQIEIDEHSADVGAITRCEAFLDSLNNVKVEEEVFDFKKRGTPSFFNKESKRTVYIP
ncbi:MAG: CoA activase, partial [Nitrospirae bacterium]|nr:CoA activase [Nitrospirota bacterium]